MRPEAKIFAVIVAGRVNLAKESPKNLKKAVVTSKRLWRHPSSADSDHIFGRFQELQAKKIHFILDSNFFIVILRSWDTFRVKGNVNKQLLVYSTGHPSTSSSRQTIPLMPHKICKVDHYLLLTTLH